MTKILLVDDHDVNRKMLAERLQSRGYEVIEACDGQEAITLAGTDPMPHVILMDLSMAVIDGWEATRQLKANEHTKNISVIALTAHAMGGDREKALEVGCDDYDTKPVNFPQLIEKIEKLVKKGQD
jgi:CheY-like chemotaxis protein